jgi:uncharacterized protein YjbI with pentapeptide repeats
MLALKQHITTALLTASEQPIPTVLTDMISEYAYVDYSVALEQFDIDKTGEITDTEKNKAIKEMIERAITSSDCDPRIKHQIFSLGTPYNATMRAALIDIIERLQTQGIQINLDGTDLSGCDLSRFDLRNMTAKGASFVQTSLIGTQLGGADFTGSTFFDAFISRTELRDTILKDTFWTRSAITDTVLIRTDLTGAKMTGMIFANDDASQIKTGDPVLQKVFDMLDDNRIGLFGVEMSGTYSTGHAFEKSNRELMMCAAEPIRNRCQSAHTALRLGSY